MVSKTELLSSKSNLEEKYFNALMSNDDTEILRYTSLLDNVEKNLKSLDSDAEIVVNPMLDNIILASEKVTL